MRKAIAILGVGLAIAAASSAAVAESGDYSVSVPLAAVSPVGDFPIHVETPEFFIDGTIQISLDAGGRLTAHAQFANRSLDLSGRFAAARGRETISLRTAGPGAARLSGKLVGTTFSGTFVDGGSLTTGVGRFVIDVTSAGPLTASVFAFVHGGFGATRRGTGRAVSSDGYSPGAPLVVDVLARGAANFRARGSRFTWTARGAVSPGAFVLTTWKARGFGATAFGKALPATFDPVPDVTLLLVNGDPHEAAPGVAPADLSTSAGPFLSHLMSVRGLEVVTSVFGDNDESAPNPGYSGLVTKLAAVRDTSVTSRAFPTRIVVVAFGHGAVRAHAAIRDVPDVSIRALIDLDGTSCGWSAQGHDTDAIGGDPVGAVEILGEPFNLEDVVFDNVDVSLQAHSASNCPDSLSGGGAPAPYDDRIHRRLDGGVDGMFRMDSQSDHDELIDVFGTSLPRIGRWLVNELTTTPSQD